MENSDSIAGVGESDSRVVDEGERVSPTLVGSAEPEDVCDSVKGEVFKVSCWRVDSLLVGLNVDSWAPEVLWCSGVIFVVNPTAIVVFVVAGADIVDCVDRLEMWGVVSATIVLWIDLDVIADGVLDIDSVPSLAAVGIVVAAVAIDDTLWSVTNSELAAWLETVEEVSGINVDDWVAARVVAVSSVVTSGVFTSVLRLVMAHELDVVPLTVTLATPSVVNGLLVVTVVGVGVVTGVVVLVVVDVDVVVVEVCWTASEDTPAISTHTQEVEDWWT